METKRDRNAGGGGVSTRSKRAGRSGQEAAWTSYALLMAYAALPSPFSVVAAASAFAFRAAVLSARRAFCFACV